MPGMSSNIVLTDALSSSRPFSAGDGPGPGPGGRNGDAVEQSEKLLPVLSSLMSSEPDSSASRSSLAIFSEINVARVVTNLIPVEGVSTMILRALFCKALSDE